MTEPTPADTIRQALRSIDAAGRVKTGTTAAGFEHATADPRMEALADIAREGLADVDALEAENKELSRVAYECQRQIREMDDTEARHDHLRRLADEECGRADALEAERDAWKKRAEAEDAFRNRIVALVLDDDEDPADWTDDVLVEQIEMQFGAGWHAAGAEVQRAEAAEKRLAEAENLLAKVRGTGPLFGFFREVDEFLTRRL